MAQLKEWGWGGEERKETFLPLLFPPERPKKIVFNFVLSKRIYRKLLLNGKWQPGVLLKMFRCSQNVVFHLISNQVFRKNL